MATGDSRKLTGAAQLLEAARAARPATPVGEREGARPVAKVFKAAELLSAMYAAKDFATMAAQSVTLEFEQGAKKKLTVHIGPDTNIMIAMQEFMRSIGEPLSIHEVQQAHNHVKQTDHNKPLASRINRGMQAFNEVSQLYKISSITCSELSDARRSMRFTVPPVRRDDNGQRAAEVWEAFTAALQDYMKRGVAENRDALVNELHLQMDHSLDDLHTITRQQLEMGERFEALLTLTDGLRTMMGKERNFHRLYSNEGYSTHSNHVAGSLVNFAAVLRETEQALDTTWAMLPQKHVIHSLADAFEKGEIPARVVLAKAWQDGVEKAQNHQALEAKEHAARQQQELQGKISEFRDQFRSDIENVRRNPMVLLKHIKAAAALAHKEAAQAMPETLRDAFLDLYRLSYHMKARYDGQNDSTPASLHMESALKSMLDAMKPLISKNFDPKNSANAHAYATLAMKAARVENAYDALIKSKEKAIATDFDTQAEQGERGLMQWTANVIDRLAQQQEAFSVTHIPSIYHTALQAAFSSMLKSRGLTESEIYGEGEKPSTNYLMRHMHQLGAFLRTGEPPEQLFSQSGVSLMQQYDAIVELTRFYDNAHQTLASGRMGPADSKTIVGRGSAVLAPEVPETVVLGGDASTVDAMIERMTAEEGLDAGDSGIVKDGAFAYDDLPSGGHAYRARPSGAESFTDRLAAMDSGSPDLPG